MTAGARGTGAACAPAVRGEGLGKWLGDREVLRGVGIAVGAGECVALLGANGAGKTTLLRILATLTPPTSGRLELFGRAVGRDGRASRARLGMIGHRPMLYGNLTARENLEFFCRLHGVGDPGTRADELLGSVGLSDRAGELVRTLSRGLTQRVGIARAIVHEPELLLADEPFTGLDHRSAEELESCLSALGGRGRALVVATHDAGRALRLAGRVVVLREGRVVLDAPTEACEERGLSGFMGGTS